MRSETNIFLIVTGIVITGALLTVLMVCPFARSTGTVTKEVHMRPNIQVEELSEEIKRVSGAEGDGGNEYTGSVEGTADLHQHYTIKYYSFGRECTADCVWSKTVKYEPSHKYYYSVGDQVEILYNPFFPSIVKVVDKQV